MEEPVVWQRMGNSYVSEVDASEPIAAAEATALASHFRAESTGCTACFCKTTIASRLSNPQRPTATSR